MNNSNQILIKAVITAGLILLMLIPTIFINSLVAERSARQTEIIKDVSNSWADSQTLVAPYIYVPTLVSGTMKSYKIIMPETLNINGNITPTVRERNVYKVLLYESAIQFNGTFDLRKVKQYANETIQWSQAQLCMGVSDMKGINSAVNISLNNGKQFTMDAYLPEKAATVKGMSTAIDLTAYDLNNPISFSSNLNVKGNSAISFVPTGNQTKVKLKSDFKNPSFFGNQSPKSTITNGFDAEWNTNYYNRSFPQVWLATTYNLQKDEYGVKLYQPSDHYTKTERSVKYVLLLIGLTFAFFFILELLQSKRVHPVQYLLVGFALVLFYTLLLSLGEYLGFNKAYFIASIATIGLITIYSKSLFGAWKHAIMIGSFLLVLYGFIFFLIQMEQLNLLVGSIGLFILLAIAMYLSRKIDWYKDQVETPPSKPQIYATQE